MAKCLRYGKKYCKGLDTIEIILANIAVDCQFEAGGFGVIGFNYQNAKDMTKWNGLKPKKWLRYILKIGKLLAISKDKDFNKAVRHKTDSNSLAAALIAAFGDGKTKKAK